jgi:hypothetical protein
MILLMDDAARNMNLFAFMQFDKSYKRVSVTNGALKECVAAFVANLDRAIALAEMLPLVVGYPSFARWVASMPDSRPSRDVGTDEVVMVPQVKPDLTNPEAYRTQASMHGYAELQFSHRTFPEIPLGMEAIFAAQVVFVWTAFETLVGDLWVAAVDALPFPLATLTGAQNRIDNAFGKRLRESGAAVDVPPPPKPESESTPDDDDRLCQDANKGVSLGIVHKLTRGTFNMSGAMGRLLAATERVQFTSLDNIRGAYSLAFSEKLKGASTSKIDAALSHPALNALSAVRNVIVHRAGVVDEDYLENAKSAPDAPQLKLKDKLLLDGNIVRKLIEPTTLCGQELIGAVDAWMNTWQLTRARREPK